jgi:photosystem II stability/assembly factor-like uncharacterized protein
MLRTYIGAQSGVYRLEGEQIVPLGLDGRDFWAIHAFNASDGKEPENDTVLAGSYGQGIFRSTDGGATWTPANQGLTATALRSFMADPGQVDAVLCGAEPGRGFRSTDRGESWQEMTGIAAVPTSAEWYLPYSPRAGALRNFHSPPGRPDHLFASIEVGGVLHSRDRGESWTALDLYASDIPDDDIHHVTGHPDRPDELWLALGWAALKSRSNVNGAELGGVARSNDGGRTWTKMITRDYTRAVIVPPARPDLVLAAPAKRVGGQGRIVVSSDGGDSWEPAGHGIEEPMADMVELFVPAPDGSIWAICAAGRLLRAEPGEWHWRAALPATDAANIRVRSVSFVMTR